MSGPQRFCRRLGVVEALQWTGENTDAVLGWGGETVGVVEYFDTEAPERLYVDTKDGTYLVDRGDWIVRGLKGGLFPCKPENFPKVYEPVG